VERLAMPHEDRPLAGRRILVVEDEFVVALDLEHMLRRLGCEVLGPVPSVAKAVALLGRERPDAALLDLNLIDGLATPVAELLAGMGVPFALATAYDAATLDHPLLKQAPRIGKPTRVAALRRGLERLLSPPGAA
jgi:CheY-like chemotaxis protein